MDIKFSADRYQTQTYLPGNQRQAVCQSGQLSTSRRLITFVQALPETLQKFGALLSRHYQAAVVQVGHGGATHNTTTTSQHSYQRAAPSSASGNLAISGCFVRLVKVVPRMLWSHGMVTNHQYGPKVGRGLAGCLLSSAVAATVGGATGIGAGIVIGGAYTLRKITMPQALLACAAIMAPTAISVATPATSVTGLAAIGVVGGSVVAGGACSLGGLLLLRKKIQKTAAAIAPHGKRIILVAGSCLLGAAVGITVGGAVGLGVGCGLLLLRKGIQKTATAIAPHGKRIIRVAGSCLLGAAVGITIGGPVGLGVGMGIGLLGSSPEIWLIVKRAARAMQRHFGYGQGTGAVPVGTLAHASGHVSPTVKKIGKRLHTPQNWQS